ncbi:hypothetical protein N7535_008776 [Penicillium sp. DV-2018c]|nr:hypothetical protein N7535_008776 [Penicillium sp. DV-2018c]
MPSIVRLLCIGYGLVKWVDVAMGASPRGRDAINHQEQAGAKATQDDKDYEMRKANGKEVHVPEAKRARARADA